MADQERLFRLALDALNVHAIHMGRQGWRVSIGGRRGDEDWPAAQTRVYDFLSTPELFDVIVCELEQLLDLG